MEKNLDRYIAIQGIDRELPQKISSDGVNRMLCQKPSQNYMFLLEECGGDPRSVAGRYALARSGSNAQRGWVPDFDARDARKR